jgi:hypothetical protein
MKHCESRLLICAFMLASSFVSAAPGITMAVREAIELASKKSGREIAEVSAREAAERSLENSAVKFGDKVLVAAGDGGLELIEASSKYGDDVMKFAVEASPAARRVLALNAEALLPLARRVGADALELEAKAPGLSAKLFAVFGDDAGKVIAKSVPADDLPRLLAYAEKSDSSATRKLLLESYQKEGKTIFERIPPTLVLAGGLTSAMLYGTHRLTKPALALANMITGDPKLAAEIAKYGIVVVACLVALVILLLMSRFNLMPWNRKSDRQSAAPVADKANSTKETNSPKTNGV